MVSESVGGLVGCVESFKVCVFLCLYVCFVGSVPWS